MEISITKLSPNGQVVIPSEIRKEANLQAATKFLVFSQDGNIMLKQLRKDALSRDMEFILKLRKSEEQISGGKSVTAESGMKDEEIDDLLMG